MYACFHVCTYVCIYIYTSGKYNGRVGPEGAGMAGLGRIGPSGAGCSRVGPDAAGYGLTRPKRAGYGRMWPLIFGSRGANPPLPPRWGPLPSERLLLKRILSFVLLKAKTHQHSVFSLFQAQVVQKTLIIHSNGNLNRAEPHARLPQQNTESSSKDPLAYTYAVITLYKTDRRSNSGTC